MLNAFYILIQIYIRYIHTHLINSIYFLKFILTTKYFIYRIHSLKHSPSDPQLNRPNTAQSRAYGRNFVASSTPPLSARNNNHNGHTNGPASARRPPPNKAQVAPSPKTEIRVAQLKPSVVQQQVTPDKHHVEIISMTSDKPYGLDVDSFLPVRILVMLAI